jgi:hypothetical protein
MGDNITTILGFAEIPLSGQYDDPDVEGYLSLEVRDFGLPTRTLVIVSNVEGDEVVTMVSLSQFEDAFDGMRARMLAPDWDDALAQITERDN